MLPLFWYYLLAVFFLFFFTFVILSFIFLMLFQNCDTLSLADRTGEFWSLRNSPSCLGRGAQVEILLWRDWTYHFFDMLSLCWPDRHPWATVCIWVTIYYPLIAPSPAAVCCHFFWRSSILLLCVKDQRLSWVLLLRSWII